MTIFDDGEQSRDFTYVDNVVAANLLAADADGANGRIFNISGGAPTTRQRARRDDRPPPRKAGRAPLPACPPRRPAELVGGRERGEEPPRIRAAGRARGGSATHRRLPTRRKGLSDGTMHSARSTSSARATASARSASRSASRRSASTRSSIRPAYEGFHHYHDTQDELYFVHSGRGASRGRGRGANPRAGRALARRVDDPAQGLERERDGGPGAPRRRRQGRLRRARRPHGRRGGHAASGAGRSGKSSLRPGPHGA